MNNYLCINTMTLTHSMNTIKNSPKALYDYVIGHACSTSSHVGVVNGGRQCGSANTIFEMKNLSVRVGSRYTERASVRDAQSRYVLLQISTVTRSMATNPY